MTQPTPPRLTILVTSTREQRGGGAVGAWVHGRVTADGRFAPRVVDLRELALPLLDGPHHPRERKYIKEHTKAWSAIVAASDAFVFVVPEYNYGMPPALLNALDYIYYEWHYKAVGFVSYGGISGGLRSVQMAKQVITTLRMMPIPEAVSVPFYAKLVTDGVFAPGESAERSATAMLDELRKWTGALAPLRQG
jgi:NAD(P)H-dependent FMN reductase